MQVDKYNCVLTCTSDDCISIPLVISGQLFIIVQFENHCPNKDEKKNNRLTHCAQ